MCGIAGVLSPSLPRLAETFLPSALRSLIHRGPDDEGSWTDPTAGIGLGHRRLSILDLSPAGHQPMHSASGRYVIVFNGEIYNYTGIRGELGAEHAAPAWRGHSDTEVMLAAFELWGVAKTLEKLVGMFAFALWDRADRVLTLARDRAGEKPLYYGRVGGDFVFASELKALKTHPAWRGEIDRGSLTLFLRHSYVPTPHSIYCGIQKLGPGTYLTVEPGAADPVVHTYWNARSVVQARATAPLEQTDREATDRLESLLREAVGAQMLADVPLGAFLSGGVDSSTIVALMQAQSTRPVKTYSIGFFEDAYNEAERAKAVARHLGTDHTELYVGSREAMAVIPKLPRIYDEPFSDSSQIPTFLICEMARQHVTVALSGDGGDELFGGYERYVTLDRWLRRLDRWPAFGRRMAAAALNSLAPQGWDRLLARVGRVLPGRLRREVSGEKLHKLARLLKHADGDLRYRDLVAHWHQPERIVIGGKEPTTNFSDRSRWLDLPTPMERMMYFDLITYLPDDILVKVDRAAMAVSLETRVPLLDHRVIEFAWRLPRHRKIRAGKTKWLLREVLHRHVPKELVERPKMGFSIPLDSWLRGPLRDWAEGLLDPSRLKREGLLDPGPIRELWKEHLAGRGVWQHLIWDVLMFQAWHESARQAP